MTNKIQFVDVLKLAENVLMAKNPKPKVEEVRNKAIEIFYGIK